MSENYRKLYQNTDKTINSTCIDEFGFLTFSSSSFTLNNDRLLKAEWHEVIDLYDNEK